MAFKNKSWMIIWLLFIASVAFGVSQNVPNLRVDQQVSIESHGTQTEPALKFNALTETGIYTDPEPFIGFSVNGTDRFRVKSGFLDLRATTVLNGVPLALDPSSSTSSPPLQFSTDADTGINRPAADTVGIVAGGEETLAASASGVAINEDVTIKDAGDADLKMVDDDTVDKDDSAVLRTNCTATGATVENCDVSLLAQIAGALTSWIDWDADGGASGEPEAQFNNKIRFPNNNATISNPHIGFGSGQRGIGLNSGNSLVLWNGAELFNMNSSRINTGVKINGITSTATTCSFCAADGFTGLGFTSSGTIGHVVASNTEIASWDSSSFTLKAPTTFENSGNVDINVIDTDTVDQDISSVVRTNCTNTLSGTENCDISLLSQIGGFLSSWLDWDADGTGLGNPVIKINHRIQFPNADATLNEPHIKFGTTNEGIGLKSSDGAITIWGDGAEVFRFRSFANQSDVPLTAPVDAVDGATDPSFADISTATTGIGFSASSVMHLIASSTEIAEVTPTTFDFKVSPTVNGSPISGGGGGGSVEPNTLTNLGVGAVAISNELDVTLTQADGFTSPAAGSGAVEVSFRDPTLSGGGFDTVSFISAEGITLEAQDSLGAVASVPQSINVYLVNDITPEICVSLALFPDDELASATALTVGAETSATTLYCDSAHTSRPIRWIGSVRATWSNPNWSAVAKVNTNRVPAYTFAGFQKFTASGTYTPSSGVHAAMVECVAGGGGGGGTDGSVSGYGAGAGGGGGSYCKSWITTGLGTSVTVTIGAGGAGGVGTSGGSLGGDTDFGTFCTTKGGTGGGGDSFAGTGGSIFDTFPGPGGHTVLETGDILINGGTAGPILVNEAGSKILKSRGGDSYFGRGGYDNTVVSFTTRNGVDGTGFGSGGEGAGSAENNVNGDGGDGAAGVCFVWEYR